MVTFIIDRVFAVIVETNKGCRTKRAGAPSTKQRVIPGDEPALLASTRLW